MKFKKGDIVKVKGIIGIKDILMKNPYHRLLKNLEMEIIGKLGRIEQMEKDTIYNKNMVRIIIIQKFNYSYRKFPLTLFENELINATEKEKRSFWNLKMDT